MKQLFIISTLLLLLSSYAFSQDATGVTQEPVEEQSTILKKKDGAWFAFGVGFQSVDVHLGYHIPNTNMDVRLLANYLYEGDFNIQAELLSSLFLLNSTRVSLFSGYGAAYHGEKGLGLVSSSGFDIAIDDRSGILIDMGVNLYFNNTNIFSSSVANHYSIAYRYSF